MTRPNLLFIVTDQQSATMMSCAGNRYLRTPAMDALAARGTRFARAYCTAPVCLPSRFSLVTGRMPSEVGVRSNNVRDVPKPPPSLLEQATGHLMRQAGYDVAYGGKTHWPHFAPEEVGLPNLTGNDRDVLADKCVEFLRAERDQPFCLIAHFVNPHDICYMAIRDHKLAEQDGQGENEARIMKHARTELELLDWALARPEGVDEGTFFAEHCPPAPDNLEPQADEPDAVGFLLDQRKFRRYARERYSVERWREHRWAYCRLTEHVDAQIARVLDALESTGQVDDTLVIFTSDHGDHDGSHRLEHKTLFYEEAARIPLLMAGPGVAEGVTCDTLVSNGLDVLPTLCDYAGITPPDDLLGQSMRPLAEGGDLATPREALPLENEVGRAIVTDRFKYSLFDEGAHREQLADLQTDPGETRNHLTDAAHADALPRLRELAAGFASDADARAARWQA